VVKKESKYFAVGDEIPQSGLYNVFHAEHRTSHKAVLLKGETFPRCEQCKDDVHFQLILEVPELDNDPNFKSFRLYEIPHKTEIA